MRCEDTELSVNTIDKENYMTKTELDPSRFILSENTVVIIKNF